MAIPIQIWTKPIETALTSLSEPAATKWGMYLIGKITVVRERDKQYCRAGLPDICEGLYYDRQQKTKMEHSNLG